MGWSTFQERIDQTNIKYRVRLENMNDKRWAKKIFSWSERKSTFRKETNRNMRRIHLKITSNDEDLEIKMNGEKVERERKVQNRKKERSRKKLAKKMESKYGKERSH